MLKATQLGCGETRFQPSRLASEAILLNTIKANKGADKGNILQNTVTHINAEEIKTDSYKHQVPGLES